MPSPTPLLSIATTDASRLLRQLTESGSLDLQRCPLSFIRDVIATNLAHLEGDHLVASQPATRAKIIHDLVELWLPGATRAAGENPDQQGVSPPSA